jgi:hypothetical protein
MIMIGEACADRLQDLQMRFGLIQSGGNHAASFLLGMISREFRMV